MSDDALDLAFRTGLPFVGLRDHEHDPELDTVVPPDAARSARAVPLAASDDHVRFAVADPEIDLAALTPYLAGRRVELAIAPREELEAVLGSAGTDQPAAPAPAEITPDHAAARDEAPKEAAPEQPLREAGGAEPPEPPDLPLGAEDEPLAAEPPPLAAEHQPPSSADPAPPPPATEGEPPAPAAEAPAAAAESEPPDAAAEPQAAASEPDEPAPASAEPTGEPPSWLEAPRKRSRFRVFGLVLLILLLLAVIGGAVAAYFVTG